MVKVMRMNIEECCEIVDEKEELYIAKLIQISPLELVIEEHKEQQVELPIDVTIFVGLSKGDKLETIVQKSNRIRRSYDCTRRNETEYGEMDKG